MIGNLSYSKDQLTGDEIMQKVEEREEEVMGGSLISFIRFDNVNPDGTKTHNVFRSLGKTVEGGSDKSLIYFKEPEDVQGTLFLSVNPEKEDAKIWLYLPALGAVKELISEQERKGSFAGSTFSYEDIGERSMVEDFNAEIIKEETLSIEDKKMDCYVLELTAKPGAEVDYPTGKMWVSKNSWLTLKSEYYNKSGNLERVIETLKLSKFEGKLTADKMINKNVLEDSSTTITFQKRIRPKKEIPDSVFDPEILRYLDPARWGSAE